MVFLYVEIFDCLYEKKLDFWCFSETFQIFHRNSQIYQQQGNQGN